MANYQSDSADNQDSNNLQARYEELQLKKSTLLTRTEKYASWTLPSVFPPTHTKEDELQSSTNSIGARAVNHLANKLIMILFPQSQPFFRLVVGNDILSEFKQRAEGGDEDAAFILKNLDQQLSDAEKSAVQTLNYNRYRTEATNVAKSLIIAGNALLYHPPGEKSRVQSYTIRDYCVVRDLSGTLIELITRNKKALSTFSKEIQDALKAGNKRFQSKKKSNCDVVLYTQIKLGEDGRYHLKQSVEDVPLRDSSGSWTADELPWIALTWNLIPGEDYGRGLVEDYAGAFHAIHVLSSALLDGIAIAADIKFLVNPGSVIDVKELNDSESGSYHSGVEGDVVAIQLNKAQDFQICETAILRYTQEIGQAFLLTSAATRDAERVTAEEIRATVNELDLSNAGIYARLAEDWQLPTARIGLRNSGIQIGGKSPIFPIIVTGLDSLSRAGDLDNLNHFLFYMAKLNEVPEDVRERLDIVGYTKFVGVRTGIDYTQFTKSEARVQAERQQRQAAEAQAALTEQAGQAVSNIATEAGSAELQGGQ